MIIGAKIEARDTTGKILGWWVCIQSANPDAGDPHGKWEWHEGSA